MKPLQRDFHSSNPSPAPDGKMPRYLCLFKLIYCILFILINFILLQKQEHFWGFYWVNVGRGRHRCEGHVERPRGL